ncbi:MAG TPA: diacylglycerol kinase, partial [Gemmatimonas sp.]|nr:diacylglycerol kinase [Gemmatimonas sp.]
MLTNRPDFNIDATLQFVVNGKAGHSDTDATCAAIEAALQAAGRKGTVLLAGPGELGRVAEDGAKKARAD